MIRKEELMIGDWVQTDLGEIQQVVELRQDGIMLAYNDFYADGELDGVPLTPEILEKNGFKPGIISWILWDEETDECLIMLKRINNAFIFPPLAGMSFGIQFVHELQRLFKLGGIKKQIVI